MTPVIVVRVPYRDPVTGIEYRRGDVIAQPEIVSAHADSDHAHHGISTELPDDHPDVIPHLPDDHPLKAAPEIEENRSDMDGSIKEDDQDADG